MQKLGFLAASLAATVLCGAAQANSFINGGFEDGTTTGWTVTGGYRGGYSNAQLSPSLFAGPSTRGQVIASSYVDPHLGAKLGSTVYSGNYGYRVEDTITGGYATVISQRVNNYTDANIFFAWKSVLEGAHGTDEAATMLITLTDLTTNSVLINRQYNAAAGGGGVDPRFAYDSSTGFYYTSGWQIEQLAINSSLQGHDFLLSVLGADCEPTGHAGYVYLDGFGAVTPPTSDVPEPASWAMMIGGFGLVGAAMRRGRHVRTAVRFA